MASTRSVAVPAEAAVEKVYAQMAYDFQSQAIGGVEKQSATVSDQHSYRCGKSVLGYFVFSDPSTGTAGYTYVKQVTNYSGVLPRRLCEPIHHQCPGISHHIQCADGQLRLWCGGYRARGRAAGFGAIEAIRADLLQRFLDFTNCAPMVVKWPGSRQWPHSARQC